MSARVSALAFSCCLFGCAAPFRGGYPAPVDQRIGARTLAEFVPGHCEDGQHQDRAPRIESVELVETATGRPLLLEHRQGHELLVAENHFDDGSAAVFQVVLSSESLVREWRIPRSPRATGTLRVGRELRETARPGGFEAELASAYLTCSLVPNRSDLPRGSTNPAP
ncbi:MAG TPA: hypothetical protein VIM73_20320 [Polyangiaceae bacterium]